MNIQFDESTLANLQNRMRERKLTVAERIAIYAFHRKGVPPKVIASAFGVKLNAIYYIANWEHTAAHQIVTNLYEEMGEKKIWAEIVTEAQTEAINDGMRRLLQGKPLHDRRHSRKHSRSARPRRAGTVAELPETASDDSGGGAPPDQ